MIKTSVCIVLLSLVLPASASLTIDMVNVGDAGNGPDPTTGKQWGAVAYAYRIGKDEITNAQYVDFLNAKARTGDPLHLYDPQMSSSALGGIVRTASGGTFSYHVGTTDQGVIFSGGNVNNRPVVFVSMYSAMRFCNWLQNGQGTGSTESGAYTLHGASPVPSNASSLTRNPGAAYFLPNDNEWYKAAFFQPASAGGDTDNYWFYPTRTNDLPNSDQPPGDPSIQTNVANFKYDDGLANGYNDGYAISASDSLANRNYMTDVGAYANAPTYYGTFDQGGNAWEWIESGSFNIARGGGWDSSPANLRADLGGVIGAGSTGDLFSDIGFRIAAAIPEPTCLTGVAAIGGLILLVRRR